MLASTQFATSRSAILRARIPAFDQHMLLNERDVSVMTSTPCGTLRRWRCAGRGPTWVKLEGSVRYHLSDVLAYVESGKRSSVRACMEERYVSRKTR
jgi:hypothetical protein